MLARIRERSDYGQTANGRWLETEFEKEPFGWDFEVVRLLTLGLLRGGAERALAVLREVAQHLLGRGADVDLVDVLG